MPTNDELLRLRRMAGEEDNQSRYTNADLTIFLEESGDDMNIAAARIWGEKASAYADLVDISEAGSSRKNSDLFTHAKEQQDYFDSLAGTGASATTGSTTRRIVRA